MIGGSGNGRSAVSWILSRLAMYVDGQAKASCLCSWARPGLPLSSTLSRGIAGATQPGFGRRGGPIWIGILCRSRWHCSFGIATVDIWMVAKLIRWGSWLSSLLACQISFVPLRSIGPAHHRSWVYPFALLAFCPRACCSSSSALDAALFRHSRAHHTKVRKFLLFEIC